MEKKLFGIQLVLGTYLILMAMLLFYVLYQVWLPQTWPKDPEEASQATSASPPSTQTTSSGSPSAGSGTPGSNAASAQPGAGETVPATGQATSASGATTSSSGISRASRAPFPPVITLFGRLKLQPSLDVRLILIVLVAGALGSYVHTTISFVDYVGNRTFVASWVWWYILRPFVGMALALILYFVVRAGFVTAQTVGGSASEASRYINPFGIAALAGMAGMFTKQATDKLSEVFTTIFRPAPGEGDDKRKDKLNNPIAVIGGFKPDKLKKGSGAAQVLVVGTGFVEKSSVHFNGSARETKFLDPTSLSFSLLASDTADVGNFEVVVVNPAPGGGKSKPVSLTIEA